MVTFRGPVRLKADEPDRFGAVVAVDGLPALAALAGLTDATVTEAAAQMRASMAALSPEAFAEGTAQSLAARSSMRTGKRTSRDARRAHDVAFTHLVGALAGAAAFGWAQHQ